jgi:uncharacterized membrane protein
MFSPLTRAISHSPCNDIFLALECEKKEEISMDIALFSTSGLEQLWRWGHYIFGVIWIGTLYYFNFIQTPFFGETDAGTKSNAVQKLVPRALWWFRYGALGTFLTGLLLLHVKSVASGIGMEVFATSWGALILTGGALGILMFLNVWLVIWPKQKIVIASTTAVAQGGKADPRAADAGARASIASRTNTLFSVPMLFFMGAASHLPVMINPERSLMTMVLVLAVIIGALELNALKGKMGVMAKIPGVLTSGVLLTAVLYGVIEFFSK